MSLKTNIKSLWKSVTNWIKFKWDKKHKLPYYDEIYKDLELKNWYFNQKANKEENYVSIKEKFYLPKKTEKIIRHSKQETFIRITTFFNKSKETPKRIDLKNKIENIVNPIKLKLAIEKVYPLHIDLEKNRSILEMDNKRKKILKNTRFVISLIKEEGYPNTQFKISTQRGFFTTWEAMFEQYEKRIREYYTNPSYPISIVAISLEITDERN